MPQCERDDKTVARNAASPCLNPATEMGHEGTSGVRAKRNLSGGLLGLRAPVGNRATGHTLSALPLMAARRAEIVHRPQAVAHHDAARFPELIACRTD